MGSSRRDIRRFPEDACVVAGYQLRRVQAGLEPNDWKPMVSVGHGVKEIRIQTGLEHRVLYVAQFVEGIYVLHAFEKRSQKTPRRDVEIARHRLMVVITERRSRKR